MILLFFRVMAFCVSCYWMAGYETGFEEFIYFFLVLFASCYIAEGVVMSVGALAPSYIIGIVIGISLFKIFSSSSQQTKPLFSAACIYGVFMLNGGFIITAKNIPDYYIWIHYIVFQKAHFLFFHFLSFPVTFESTY